MYVYTHTAGSFPFTELDLERGHFGLAPRLAAWRVLWLAATLARSGRTFVAHVLLLRLINGILDLIIINALDIHAGVEKIHCKNSNVRKRV